MGCRGMGRNGTERNETEWKGMEGKGHKPKPLHQEIFTGQQVVCIRHDGAFFRGRGGGGVFFSHHIYMTIMTGEGGIGDRASSGTGDGERERASCTYRTKPGKTVCRQQAEKKACAGRGGLYYFLRYERTTRSPDAKAIKRTWLEKANIHPYIHPYIHTLVDQLRGRSSIYICTYVRMYVCV